jgi:hypothetical protein
MLHRLYVLLSIGSCILTYEFEENIDLLKEMETHEFIKTEFKRLDGNGHHVMKLRENNNTRLYASILKAYINWKENNYEQTSY